MRILFVAPLDSIHTQRWIMYFGDNRLWTENEKSGLLFPLEDYKTLTEKIISFLKNPDLAKKWANQAEM